MLKCMELSEFIARVGEDRALKALSSFSVKRNPDVESFIRNNAVAYEMMRKMRGFGRYSADSVPCYLLGQLARDDNASHDDLMMRDFIDFAIEYAMAAKQYVGGRFLLVDCVDELVDLYERHDFSKINKAGVLNQLVMFLS